ncbi:MAG TPA: ribonuclease III [Bryobacteraceae bacterium]|jgi:ribonuclease-3|nr:ribonuclease III [Bryobacteraceae bacterium]
MQSNLDELEQALGYRFANRGLLTRAVTHSSSANEVVPTAALAGADNERLEFLGDSVLGWLVSDWLFARFRDFNEGQLSLLKNHLVSATHLLAAAQRLDLGRYLQLGRGEETAGGRSKQRILVNAFEAVLAAMYLDGGAEPAREILNRFVLPPDEELTQLAGSGPPHDFRAELERLARDRKLPRPLYFLASESGPGHARTFTVEVRIGKEFSAAAEGSSKKQASHNAARRVCELLKT